MAIKHRKDLSGCKAWTKACVPFYKGHYYKIFLWDNLEALRANIIPNNGPVEDGILAFTCHAPYLQTLPASGCAYAKAPRHMGEIHFLAGEWNLDIVAHEIFHMVNNVSLVLRITPQQNIEFEERAAYMQGALTQHIYEWLWKVDAPKYALYLRLLGVLLGMPPGEVAKKLQSWMERLGRMR